MKQSAIFLESEGNAYHGRNASKGLLPNDPVIAAIEGLDFRRVLEIGCGGGDRLAALRAARGALVTGLDPSGDAVSQALRRGIEARQGTADDLPFSSNAYDLVIFGFCLYLCDRDDLFKIASEADRVTADGGHIVIFDFDNEPSMRPYAHRPGLWSYRMRYPEMFLWHPRYALVSRTNFEEDIYVTVLEKALA